MPDKAMIERALSLPAGRELDAVIWEVLTGEKPEWKLLVDWGGDESERWREISEHARRGRTQEEIIESEDAHFEPVMGGSMRPIWYYSTDSGEAMGLLRKMLYAGCWVMHMAVWNEGEFRLTVAPKEGKTIHVSARGAYGIDLAICRAWLIWRGSASDPG